MIQCNFLIRREKIYAASFSQLSLPVYFHFLKPEQTKFSYLIFNKFLPFVIATMIYNWIFLRQVDQYNGRI